MEQKTRLTELETIKKIQARTGAHRSVIKEIIHTYRDLICEEIKKGNKHIILNLGVFYPKEWKSRVGRNPKTGEKIDIPEKKSVGFRASAVFLNEINENK